MLGMLGGLAFVLAKVLGARSGPNPSLAPSSRDRWPRLASDPTVPSVPATPAEESRLVPDAAAPDPTGTAPSTGSKERTPTQSWVEPGSNGCPASHPVKAKLRSKIFHLPGMANYERTQPDRCYLDAQHAEGDGLRAAKR